jgi:hypothetical protein
MIALERMRYARPIAPLARRPLTKYLPSNSDSLNL